MIRRARQEDISEIKKWLHETAISLQQKEIQQWQKFLTAEGREVVAADFYKGYLYVYTNDKDEPIASISLCDKEKWDASLWKDDKKAYYVHRVVVSSAGKGQSIGGTLLTWSKQKACKEGKVLRLDCLEENSFLVSFYKNKGFKQVGTVNGFALFEAK
ncbi:GNAT family N-acetyltransferase [Bacillus manliponensis]|uniref:GNAT family N-acetyltransferase n=1 Tax=Bacillus manliponensis TaxID=574376 RepID=UPI003516D7E9